MYGGMKIAYGYKCAKEDLAGLGADKVYIDTHRKRPQRDAMLQLDVREGDQVLVRYLRHLGGSPVADRVWREKIEARGARVVVVPPEPGAVGRPKDTGKLPPEHEPAARAIWLSDGAEVVRLERIRDLVGHAVGKGLLVGRFGVPSNPK